VAHTLNTAIDTLTDEVEPFLLRSELVVRTPRGRKLTAKGYEHLGVTPDARRADGGNESLPLFAE
jgi:Holliday junction DNA helicase RuvB